MNYVGYTFFINPIEPWSDILLAKLSLIEFESFEEFDQGLKAYIAKETDDEDYVKETLESLSEAQITYDKEDVPTVNWNEEWEKHFDPILVNDQCYIRADFHEPKNVPYEIVIQPKMSFGTGHHSTTHLMIELLLELNLEGKHILDMGTGTGILAILAKMKGASYVEGIDIDQWSYDNASENAEKNQVDVILKLGGAEQIDNSQKFDLIVANINRNILLRDLPLYVSALKPKGQILLSGLCDFDYDTMIECTTENGLEFERSKQRNEWIAILLKRKNYEEI